MYRNDDLKKRKKDFYPLIAQISQRKEELKKIRLEKAFARPLNSPLHSQSESLERGGSFADGVWSYWDCGRPVRIT
ncbi:MAG: hypothetical protein WC155_11235, partial [Candidatus Cloacimonadales bacterium]